MPQMIENHIFPHAAHSKHTLPLSSRQTSAAIPRLSGQTRAAAPARAQKAADEFARYLLTRNLADETLRAYTYAVRQYFTYYRDITYPNLKLYKIFLLEHYKPQTINQRIRALNAYLDFKKLYPGHLPMVKIQQKTYLDHMISEADYEYLKRCLLRDERYTYYFLIRFMAATGVRVSEVIQFQAEDIFSGYKDIYSKGNKVRRIYIPQSLRTDTLKWLSFLHKSHGPIFLNRFDSTISRRHPQPAQNHRPLLPHDTGNGTSACIPPPVCQEFYRKMRRYFPALRSAWTQKSRNNPDLPASFQQRAV